MMNNDERLEAAIRNLEVVTSMQIENERRIGILTERQSELAVAMTRLAGIVFDHEERISALETR